MKKFASAFQSSKDAAPENILFASLKLPPLSTGPILECIRSAPEAAWIPDEYRKSSVLPLMTNRGGESLFDIQNQTQKSDLYQWTKWAHRSLSEYFDINIWPWTGQKSRVTVLRTRPGEANAEHIDCSPDQVGTLQLKFRLILQGRSGTLYFIDHLGLHVSIPDTERPFLIDGGWPHGMVNDSEKEKFTICMGAPWTSSLQYPFFEKVLLKSQYQMPQNLDPFINRTK